MVGHIIYRTYLLNVIVGELTECISTKRKIYGWNGIMNGRTSSFKISIGIEGGEMKEPYYYSIRELIDNLLDLFENDYKSIERGKK